MAQAGAGRAPGGPGISSGSGTIGRPGPKTGPFPGGKDGSGDPKGKGSSTGFPNGFPPSSPGNSISGSSGAPSQKVFSYRGKRTSPIDLPLVILNKSIFLMKNNTLQLIINFNQAVDPTNFTFESFYVNERQLNSDAKIKFNRKADSVTIIMGTSFISKEELEKAFVRMKNIHTFDGKVVEELIIK